MKERNLIGKKIKEIRKEKKMTQDELATKLNLLGLNIDRPMISKIENHTREISDFEIKAISEVFQVEIGELFDV